MFIRLKTNCRHLNQTPDSTLNTWTKSGRLPFSSLKKVTHALKCLNGIYKTYITVTERMKAYPLGYAFIGLVCFHWKINAWMNKWFYGYSRIHSLLKRSRQRVKSKLYHQFQFQRNDTYDVLSVLKYVICFGVCFHYEYKLQWVCFH